MARRVGFINFRLDIIVVKKISFCRLKICHFYYGTGVASVPPKFFISWLHGFRIIQSVSYLVKIQFNIKLIESSFKFLVQNETTSKVQSNCITCIAIIAVRISRRRFGKPCNFHFSILPSTKFQRMTTYHFCVHKCHILYF